MKRIEGEADLIIKTASVFTEATAIVEDSGHPDKDTEIKKLKQAKVIGNWRVIRRHNAKQQTDI